MLWRVTSLRQVVQVQRILANQKQQIAQAASMMTRRLSRSVAKSVPMAGMAPRSPVVSKPSSLRAPPSSPGRPSVAATGPSAALSTASPRKLAQETEARLQHEVLVEVLDGRRPEKMATYLFAYGGPLLVIYIAATVYYFAICELQVKRVLITNSSRYEHQCECSSPALNLYSWMFMLLTHLIMFAFNIMAGWSQRHIAYNVYEARRTALATLNGVFGTVIYVVLQVLGSSYSLTMFYVALLLFVAFSSFAIYIGPLFLRIHATNGVKEGSHDARQVDSNESLSTNRSQTASSTSSSGGNGGRGGSRPSRVREESVREPSSLASGLHAQQVNLPETGDASASAFPRDQSVLTTSMLDGSTPVDAGGISAVYDLPVFVRCPGMSKMDRFVLGLQQSRALQTMLIGGGKNGVVWERYRWTRVELWCFLPNRPITDPSVVPNPHVSKSATVARPSGGNQGSPANPSTYPTSRRTTNDNAALTSSSPSPFLVLRGTCSHVWMLLQFPHARHARRFAGLFAPPKTMTTDTSQPDKADQITNTAAAGLMSVF
ncbi:hypothetical protein BCR44DRAFT_1430682 [Catenaria anguillulae PL171]|uniref:Uncharacterized protein n=1 Tax=Catenaria anguillulae PL171 TaxID=765915 RepID=A0A1Y2HRJ2_9FUNG|nr:hypothetical protein BCR44DRAFT_1430682 [Catenaria anguillulae PL171]